MLLISLCICDNLPFIANISFSLLLLFLVRLSILRLMPLILLLVLSILLLIPSILLLVLSILLFIPLATSKVEKITERMIPTPVRTMMMSCVLVMFSTHRDRPAREALVTRHSGGTALRARPSQSQGYAGSPTG